MLYLEYVPWKLLFTAYIGLTVYSVVRPYALPTHIAFYPRLSAYCAFVFLAAATALVTAPYALYYRHDPTFINWVFLQTLYFLSHKALGINVVVTGHENLPPFYHTYVMVSNHQSGLDLVWLAKACPRKAIGVAKDTLKYIPLIGQALQLAGTVFIDRGSSKESIAKFQELSREMHHSGTPVLVFPEGTRDHAKTIGMLSFKKGAFHLAVQAHAPIVPIVVANMSNVFHRPSLVFKPGTIRVQILPPVETTHKKTAEDVNELAHNTWNMMIAAMKKMPPMGEQIRDLDDLSDNAGAADILAAIAADMAHETARAA
ncbi:1-acylglycerol-3-phosphate O [Ramicandelaber brevisporus]|nr:1-acylglycerol-3-phosphate O [Ramicandelaber brevisporus]